MRKRGACPRHRLLFCWRPRRDLNPCYRRERAPINSQHLGTAENQNASERIIATLTNSLGAPQMSAKNQELKLWSTPLNKGLSKRVGGRQVRKKGPEDT